MAGSPRIVVLDGFTMNPGDLDWSPLRALGECLVHDRTPPDQAVARLRDADAAITNKVVLGAAELASLPALRYIGVAATGYNVVDLTAARERGIVVTNVPAYSTPSVAQLTFALLLELTNRAGAHSDAVRAGRWASCPDFSFCDHPQIELDGLTMGIVGLGAIGQAVARIALALGMRALATRASDAPSPVAGVGIARLEELLRQADVVSLHCPLTTHTLRLINTTTIALMKPTAYLINTGRGPLVDEGDLAAALNARRLAGAAVDVLSTEPPRPDNPLLTAANCVITPHVGWASPAARRRLMAVVIANLQSFLEGRPQNVVA